MAAVSDYEVIVTREGDSWLADVHAVPGAHTFARSLAGLARSVREVMAHTSAAVAQLAREGYSVRDAAALLDLTPGRVSQLLKAIRSSAA